MTAESSSVDLQPEVLAVMADESARSILAATAQEYRTVPELVDNCGIPTASAYRKVNKLAEMGLLDKSVRIRSEGRNANEYTASVEALEVHITESGVNVTCSTTESRSIRGDPAVRTVARGRHLPIGTGTAVDRSTPRTIHSVLVDVTGTESAVENER